MPMLTIYATNSFIPYLESWKILFTAISSLDFDSTEASVASEVLIVEAIIGLVKISLRENRIFALPLSSFFHPIHFRLHR
ncbi:hypothetical protein IEQ34_012853 [Dendrobium chrysotoxum]|uniref:Uncharacterized protein n=1 Tax=Dendrobium chrysotoxum TaxID=161865 RepID=A0AAV7GPC9_DENCH|nr:hypothetical protein IEQ34_012853 [Dendrobium chrysotoxum]